jgi:hypothetical protein
VKEWIDPDDGRRECLHCGVKVVGYGPSLRHEGQDDPTLEGADPVVVARARSTDPMTSHAAAASVGDLRPNQRAVLGLLRCHPGGLTDEQMVVHYQDSRRGHPEVPAQTESGLRTRRKELVDAGLVVDTGEKRKTAAGRATKVWKALPPPGTLT